MPLRSLVRSPWLPALVTGLAAGAMLLGSGTTGRDLALFAAYVTVCVAFPGIFVWRLMLWRLHTGDDTPPTWLEDATLGTIFGFGLQLPLYLVGVVVGIPRIVVLLPVAAAVASLTPLGRRVWRLPTSSVDFRAAWALGATATYGVLWLTLNTFTLRPMWLAANKTPSVDETFHQALIAEVAHRFPPQLPFMLDTKLDYHWFVHAQLATARWMTGVDSVVMLRQLAPALFLLLTVAGITAVTLRLTRRLSTSVLAAVILVVGGFHMLGPHYNVSTYTEGFLSNRYMSSPSQSYGDMMVLPVLFLAFEVLRPGNRAGRWTWVTLAFTLLALAGAKATFLPIFLIAGVVMWLFQLVATRRVDRAATWFVALLLVATAFAQFVLFGGQTGGMDFAPLKTAEAALTWLNLPVDHVAVGLMTATLLMGWLLYGVGVVGLVQRGRWKDPRAVWLIVAVPVGIGPALVFFRSGLSQLWFQRSVAELVVILSAWGLTYLLPDPLPRRQGYRLVGLAALVGFVAFGVAALMAPGGRLKSASAIEDTTGRIELSSLALTVAVPLLIVVAFGLWWLLARRADRVAKPTLVVLVVVVLGLGLANVFNFALDRGFPLPQQSKDYPTMFATGGVEAANYIRRKSSVDDVVATNVHCAEARTPRCDNRSFWVSAYTERRIVLEGWGYSAITNKNFVPGMANRFIPTPYPDRLAINDAAFLYPSEYTVGRLIDTYDVRWLLVDKEYPADIAGLNALPSLITNVFENDNYVVYQVNQ
jgi:hypothetical protein